MDGQYGIALYIAYCRLLENVSKSRFSNSHFFDYGTGYRIDVQGNLEYETGYGIDGQGNQDDGRGNGIDVQKVLEYGRVDGIDIH